jgi:tetratricopeptide (TPR) repeat protein
MARRDRHGMHVEDQFVRSTFSLLESLKTYKTQFTIAVLIALGVVLGWFAYRAHLAAFNESALSAFENAKTTADYKRVIDMYPGSNVEPPALFYYGKKLIDDKKYDEAATVFESLLEEYPRHSLAPGALAFRGMIHEQKGERKEAIESYQLLLEKYPDSFIKERVLLNMGLCYEKLGIPGEAKATYEKFIEEYPTSSWKTVAEGRLSQIKPKAAVQGGVTPQGAAPEASAPAVSPTTETPRETSLPKPSVPKTVNPDASTPGVAPLESARSGAALREHATPEPVKVKLP